MWAFRYVFVFCILFLLGCKAEDISSQVIVTPNIQQEKAAVSGIPNVTPVEKVPEVSKDPRIIITIKDFDFFPRNVEINRNSTVKWVHENEGPNIVHMIKIHGINKVSTKLSEGDTFNQTFEKEGVYRYFDVIHAKDMFSGKITVV